MTFGREVERVAQWCRVEEGWTCPIVVDGNWIIGVGVATIAQLRRRAANDNEGSAG